MTDISPENLEAMTTEELAQVARSFASFLQHKAEIFTYQVDSDVGERRSDVDIPWGYHARMSAAAAMVFAACTELESLERA